MYIGSTRNPLQLKEDQIDFYPKACQSPVRIYKTCPSTVSIHKSPSKKKIINFIKKLDLASQNNAISKAKEIEKAYKPAPLTRKSSDKFRIEAILAGFARLGKKKGKITYPAADQQKITEE